MQTTSTNMMTWNEALTKYGMDFDVEKIPLLYRNQDGLVDLAPNLYGMQRQDNLALLNGVAVAKSYEIIQTSSYADIGDRITAGTQAEFVKGGVIGRGRLVYLQAKLPDTIRVKNTNDVINKYITFINSFDGSSAFRILINGVRMLCKNQLPSFVREGKRERNALSIRHTKSAPERLLQADRMVLEANNLFKAFEVKVNWLADQKFTDLQMNLLARRMFKVEDDTVDADIATRTLNNIAKVKESFENGIGISGWRGTSWAAHNAVTEFHNHYSSIRVKTNRFENNLIGSGALGMQRGLAVLDNMLA